MALTKDWRDLPAALAPTAGETLAEHNARIDAYDLANPGVLTFLSAAAMEDLEARAQARDQFDPPSAVQPTVAPFVTGRMRLRDRWSAGDFGWQFDGSDETAAAQSAVRETRAAGRVLHLPEGATAVTGSLTDSGDNLLPLRVRGAGKGATVINHAIAAASMFSVLGTVAAKTTLTAAAARGATTIIVASTTGIAAGDVIILRDPTQPILGNSAKSQAAAAGQMRIVRTVASATSLVLYGRVSWTFTSGSDVRLLSGPRVQVSDLSIVNPTPGTMANTARAMTFAQASGIDIQNVEFKDLDANAIQLQTCWDFRVASCDWYGLRDLEQANAPYCVFASQGTSFGLMQGCKGHYGRHLFTTGPKADGTEIPCQDIHITGCEATGFSQAAFDCHPGAVRMHFSDCHAFGCAGNGFQVRGPDCSISNPIVSGATTGILAVDGADRLRVRGGVLLNTDIGLDIQDSNDVRVRGVEIADPIITGVRGVQEAAWAGTMNKLSLRDIEVTGDPSGYAYDFSGRWADGFELRDCRAPDATRKVIGAPTTPTLNGLLGQGWAGDMTPTGLEGAALSLGLAAGTAHLARYVPPTNRTITKLAFTVTTASGLDDNFEVSIYSLHASAGVLTRIATSGVVTSASGAVSGGGLNTTGRKVVTIPTVAVVGGTVYYVEISAAVAGATISAGGTNSTITNTLMGAGVPDIIVGSKAASHPGPATIGGPAQALTGPKMAVLE